MKILIIISSFALSLNSFAESKKSHRHHEAHVHGAAELSIAFDQLNGKIEFKAAAEGVLGFEHQPKTEKEMKKLQEAISNFEKNISQMVQLDSAAECIISKDLIDRVGETEEKDVKNAKGKHKGEHSNFVANFSVVCKKDIRGSRMTVDFSGLKKIKDMDVTVLVGDFQKSFEAKGRAVTVELK